MMSMMALFARLIIVGVGRKRDMSQARRAESRESTETPMALVLALCRAKLAKSASPVTFGCRLRFERSQVA